MLSARFGCAISILSVAWVGNATAQSVRNVSPVELAQLASDTTPHPRWFQLEMPLIAQPLMVSWTTTPVPTYELLRWPAYNWEARVWSNGPVNLLSFNRVQPAIELDCLKSTCQPKLEKTLGFESRVQLGGKGVLPDNYLFMRRETVFGPVRSFGRIKLGIGGLLDF